MAPANKPDLKRGRRWSRAGTIMGIGGCVLALAGLFLPFLPGALCTVGYLIAGFGLFTILAAGSVLGLIAICFCTLLLTGMGIFPILVVDKPYTEAKPRLEEADDAVAEKRPSYVKGFTVGLYEGWFINHSQAVIGIDLGEATPEERVAALATHPTFQAACQAAKALAAPLLPSVDLLDAAAKRFDDRLVEALERELHRGDAVFPGGKQGFLAALLAEVMEDPAGGCPAAGARLAAAIELGGGKPEAPAAVLAMAREAIAEFNKDRLLAKPIGIYTKDETLAEIFRRDRFLQQPLHVDDPVEMDTAARLTAGLDRRPDLALAYRRFLSAGERLANPEANLNLEDLASHRAHFGDGAALGRALAASPKFARIGGQDHVRADTLGVAFWPWCTSKENRLFCRLYEHRPDGPAGDVMADLITAIREGELSLAPAPESGWYDHRLHSLETLVLPERAEEASKLLLHRRYKKRLRQAFEAMLAKRRETQVKALMLCKAMGHPRREEAGPGLAVEPCATSYLRTARAYRFLRRSLAEILDGGGLARIRMAVDGRPIGAALDELTRLFYGAYLVVCGDLGLAPSLEPGELAELGPYSSNRVPPPPVEEIDPLSLGPSLLAAFPELPEAERDARQALWTEARAWLRELAAHGVGEDQRVIVPIARSADGSEARYWAVLGVKLVKIKAWYVVPPRLAADFDQQAAPGPDPVAGRSTGASLTWRPQEYWIPVQAFREIRLGSEPPTREEFRAACDRGGTEAGILRELGVGGGAGWLPWAAGVLAAGFVLGLAIRRRRRARFSRRPEAAA